MPLTREQFDELYNQGVSVDQIAAFEQGKKPKDLEPKKKSSLPSQSEAGKKSMFKGMVDSALNAVIVRPAIRFGEAIAGAGIEAFGSDETKKRFAEEISKDVETPLGTTVAGVKKGAEGAKQVIGEAADSASYLVGGGGTAKAVATGLRKQVIRGAATGSLYGGASGALQTFGNAIQEAENKPAAVAYQTLFGTLVGAGGGFILGAAAPLVVKGANGVATYSNLGKLETKLYEANREALKPNSSQLAEWTRKKVDPIKTFTQEFGAEGIPSKGDKLHLDDLIEQTDTRYRAGAEGFNTILRNSPEVVSLSSREAEALANIESSMLTPTQKASAKVKVHNEFVATKEEAARNGFLLGDDNIPVAYADNLKDRSWRATRNFGTEEGSVANEVNKSIGFAYKEGIEEAVTDVNVRNYNKKLQELITLKEFLESRNGKVPGTGGKMLRYTTRIVGGMAGSSGGVPGTIVGAITADKLAQAIASPEARTWLIRKQLAKLAPEARASLQAEAEAILAKMAKKRAETLGLPAANTGGGKFPATPNVINASAPGTIEKGVSRTEAQNAGLPPLSNEPKLLEASGKNPIQLPKNTQGGFVQAYVEKGDLTTKLLTKLEGRTTVSKQFISDLTNSADMKQVEKDIIRQILQGEKDTVSVADFAEKVKNELLPLKVKASDTYRTSTKPYHNPDDMLSEGDFTPKYEMVSLPKELRGRVANYRENIYESPIKTSAGNAHFGYTTDNYFGHTRIEDMADNKTRRVIEVQSDLYQKGNLERELEYGGALNYEVESRYLSAPEKKELADLYEKIPIKDGKDLARYEELTQKNMDLMSKARKGEVSKLQQYNDPTAHFRMVREEIKKAAQDGKTKLQFPTGETAMKIEGLGQNNRFYSEIDGVSTALTKPEQLKVGMTVGDGSQPWIVTEVLGDGKFKALPTEVASKTELEFLRKGKLPETLTRSVESFDISGKLDTNNPIYRFYEKDMGKYLKNNFNAQTVTDKQGVTWYEVPITKDLADKPITAFGKIATSPLIVGAGGTALLAGGTAALKPKTVTFGDNNKHEPVQMKSDNVVEPRKLGEALMQLESSGGKNKANADEGEMKWLTGLTSLAIAELKRKGIKEKVEINDKEDVLDASVKYFQLMQERYPEKTPAEVYVDLYWTQAKNKEQRQKKIDEFNKLIK